MFPQQTTCRDDNRNGMLGQTPAVKSKTLTLAKGSILETTDGINRVVVISIQKTQHHLMDNKGKSKTISKIKLDRAFTGRTGISLCPFCLDKVFVLPWHGWAEPQPLLAGSPGSMCDTSLSADVTAVRFDRLVPPPSVCLPSLGWRFMWAPSFQLVASRHRPLIPTPSLIPAT